MVLRYIASVSLVIGTLESYFCVLFLRMCLIMFISNRRIKTKFLQHGIVEH